MVRLWHKFFLLVKINEWIRASAEFVGSKHNEVDFNVLKLFYSAHFNPLTHGININNKTMI